jgi:hypothetical protein
MVTRDHAEPPPLGLVELKRLPAESPATQSAVLGHDTVSIWLKSSTAALDHAASPPAGAVDVKMSPASSTMAQRPLAVQETPPVQLLPPVASTGAATQADAPPVGLDDATS